MSLYKSLDRFVGAGLLAWANAAGWTEPTPDTLENGVQFSAFLRDRGEAAPFGALLDTLAQEIWLSQDTRGIPHQVAEAHAVTLAAILATVGPKPSDVAASMAEGGPGRRIDQFATVVAADLMSRVMAVAEAADLRPDVVLFLLERLVNHIVIDPSLLAGLRPSIELFAAQRPDRSDGLAEAGHAVVPGVPAPPPSQISVPAAPSAPIQLVPAPSLPLAPARPGGSSELAGAVALKAKYRLTDAAFQRFVQLLDAQTVRPEQRLARLEELGAWLEATVAQLTRRSNDDADTRALKEQAARALAEGEFETAVDLLKSVRRSLRAGRHRTEQRLQEEMHNLKSQMSEEAIATGRLAELALARSEYDDAADLYSEAAASAPHDEPDLALGFRLRYADVLYRQGEDLSQAKSLAAAARAYGEVAAQALKLRFAKPFASAKRGEGSALFRLGENETDATKLRAAVAAWREALPHVSRPDEAIARGLLHVQIGAACAAIAERELQAESLAEANVELRRAIELLPAAIAPIDRATAELYLGRTLVALFEGGGAHEMLPEAITLFSSAAAAWQAAQQPMQWAAAQLNLGAALVRIGDIEDRRSNWTAATTAFIQALEVFETEGAEDNAEQVRSMVRQLHARLEADATPTIASSPRRVSGL